MGRPAPSRGDGDRPLTTGEVAAVLGVPRRAAVGLIDSGRLPGYRVGRDRRVARAALAAYLRSRGRPVPADIP